MARQLESAQQLAAQAAVEKRNAQRLLLESAQAHAEMQHKTALATREMADAKRRLLEAEAQRLEADTQTLVATKQAIELEQAESAAGAVQRAASANITHEVIGRLTQPSASVVKA